MEQYSYGYHPEYFYFTDRHICIEDPLQEGEFLCPGDSTPISPPETGDNEIAVFDVNTNSWSVVENMGGEWYNISNGILTINYNLAKKPENSTRKKPPIDFIPHLKYDSENDNWIINIDYDPENTPKCDIFPEILPAPNLNVEPIYSGELKRWTYRIMDPSYTERSPLEQYPPEAIGRQEVAEILQERIQALENYISSISEIVGVSSFIPYQPDDSIPPIPMSD
jgi:hypothetical protein